MLILPINPHNMKDDSRICRMPFCLFVIGRTRVGGASEGRAVLASKRLA